MKRLFRVGAEIFWVGKKMSDLPLESNSEERILEEKNIAFAFLKVLVILSYGGYTLWCGVTPPWS